MGIAGTSHDTRWHKCIAGISLAQVNYQPGYIVKSAGDTLYGWIDYRTSGIMSEVCTFREDKNAPSTAYKPAELRSFQLARGKIFISEKVANAPHFLEVLYNGCLEVYALKTTAGEMRYFAHRLFVVYNRSTIWFQRCAENSDPGRVCLSKFYCKASSCSGNKSV